MDSFLPPAANIPSGTTVARSRMLPGVEHWRGTLDGTFKLSLDSYLVGLLKLERGELRPFVVLPYDVLVAEGPGVIDLLTVPAGPLSPSLVVAPRPTCWISGDDAAKVAQHLPRVLSSFRDGKQSLSAQRNALRSLLSVAFDAHLRISPPLVTSGCDRAVMRAKETLQQNLRHTLSLDELADHVKVSKYYLARRFSERLGVAPLEYRRLARLRTALKLIRSGASLRDVADQSGFVDRAHLTRVVKRLGFTPGAYRSVEILERASSACGLPS